MASGRSWIGCYRYNEAKYLTEEYKIGVDSFIKFAIEHLDEEDNGLIRCPCKNCGNKYYKNPNAVKVDLYRFGIMQRYTRWDCHGEKNMLRNDVGTSFANANYRDDDMYDANNDNFEDYEDFEEEPNATAKEFYKMVNTASEPIYPNNANFRTLEFVMELFRWKNRHNCSNNGFDELLHLIGLVLPDDHKFPEKYYIVRKMIKGLNMEYEKIDACENDCMLFYKENSNKTYCDICKRDRYKVQKDPKKQNIPRKILRYFPITMRLQRLFMTEKTAKCMRWHHDRVVVEGQLSHPADGDEWKEFDRRFTRFSKEIQNVRLGLSTDGFDPFRDAHAKEYTVWPVVIVVYNLPPSMCTKGIVFLHPRETLSELVAAQEAAKWINSATMKNSQALTDVQDVIYPDMSTILDEVRQMVRSFPMREVKQYVLDENVDNLAAAAAASSDPNQHLFAKRYAWATKGLLPLILKENDKIIAKESLPKKSTMMDGTKAGMVDGIDDFEDEDPDAHMFLLY